MRLLTTLLVSAVSLSALAQNPNPIRVNQVGYYPAAEKTAAIEQAGMASKYTITNAAGKKVWSGKAKRTAVSPWSNKQRAIIDFSTITTPGEYTLSNGKETQQIIIKDAALSDLAKASVKAFYLQRTGEPILEKYAGVYARPAAHLDTYVMIHPSAATDRRPAGSIISSPGGWYDAGDFNKYIVNSGYSVSLMLCAYEMCPEYYQKLDLNIPESGNAIPDYLDEIMVNLRWMQTMQDPADGGVYHKLTTPNFEGFVMPVDCHQQRYVVAKTTAAALDFAATMAKASRIYGKFPEFKYFAAQALQQAKDAYAWAERNPRVLYRQNEMNQKFKPEVQTGAYDDMNVSDEFLWAAAELLLSTGDLNRYGESIVRNLGNFEFSLPTWGNVASLAVYSAVAALDSPLLSQYKQYIPDFKNIVVKYADKALAEIPTSCFNTPGGNSEKSFFWGCLSETFSGQGIALLYTYRLTGDKKYLTAALENADYLLGRNATGYCYVTGFGSFPSMHPHQRLSEADGIEAPLPGFLVGGPNPGQQDRANTPEYSSKFADESYLDHMASYASNEIAINWNASLAAFIGWLDAEMSK